MHLVAHFYSQENVLSKKECKETDCNSVLQSLMLSIAKGLLEAESKEREEERKRYMAETCPSLSLPSGIQALQVLT